MTTAGVITIWHWWALGGALMMVELLAPGFFFLWLGAAAALVGLALVAWPEMPSSFQLVLYAALAVLSMLAWRRVRMTMDGSDAGGDLNRKTAQFVGRRANLLDPIRNGRGRISLGDGSWTVEGPDLPAGSVVEITGAEGTLLHVRPV
jgi:membrane protein implicated in regulation of membrane protease activity